MKIASITATPYRLPLKIPFKMAGFTVQYMNYVKVEVTDEAGHVGVGEAAPSWDVNGETPDSVIGCVRLFQDCSTLGFTLIGQPLATLDDVKDLMLQVINPSCSAPLIAGNSAAKAAMEQAMLNCIARQRNISLLSCFDVQPGKIPFTNTISICDVDTTLKYVQDAIATGAQCIRLKLGCRDAGNLLNFERDIQVIQKSKAIIYEQAPSVKLVGDANQGYVDAKTTIRICKAVDKCLDWLEQPVLADDIYGFSRIREAVETPLMADESLSSPISEKLLMEQESVSYFNVKLMKTGGLFSALALVDRASKSGIGIHIGSMIESNLGIQPGHILYYLRANAICSTDLNVCELLEQQPTVVEHAGRDQSR